jgi:hypothetical protein
MTRQGVVWTFAVGTLVFVNAGHQPQQVGAAAADLTGNWNLRAAITVSFPRQFACSFLDTIGDPNIGVTHSDRDVIALDADTNGQRFTLQGVASGTRVDFTIRGFGITPGSGQCSVASRNFSTDYSGTLSADARSIIGTVWGSAEYAFDVDVNGSPVWRVVTWTGTFTATIGSCLSPSDRPRRRPQSAILTVPAAVKQEDGNSNNCLPFSSECPPGLFHAPTLRYQQVYSAAEFDAQDPVILKISEIRFRLNWFPFRAQYSDFQINMSTTTAAPRELSQRFADNVGSDDFEVFSGRLKLETHASPTAPFLPEIEIHFESPFLYDPAAGNLLLDIRRLSPARLGSQNVMAILDAHFGGNSIARVFAGAAEADRGFTDSLPGGLVTTFKVHRIVPSDCSVLP